MLVAETRVRPNTADVAAKVIDGEAIIMNLSNGLYFSMDRVGSALWEMVEMGWSVDEMTDAVVRRFDVDRDTARRDVVDLMARLLDEALVLVTDDAPEEHPAPTSAGGPDPYAPPSLQRYDDMADLLALDPPMPGLGSLPAE